VVFPPVLAYLERIATDEELLEISHRAEHAARFRGQGGLAPTMQAGFVGFDFDIGPVGDWRLDAVGFDVGDFHAGLHWWLRDCSGGRSLQGFCFPQINFP
jgi:hypothetical protein